MAFDAKEDDVKQQNGKPNGSNSSKDKGNNDALMKLRFRNYIPRTEDLKKYSEDHIDASEPLRKMKESHDKLINTINLKFNDPALDIDNLVPRKGNWDIKRSLAPKLERLERRTQRAIIRIAQKTKETKRLNEPELPDTSSDEEDDTGA